VEIAAADAQYFVKAAGGEIKVARLIEDDSGNVGAHLLAVDFAFLDSADDDQLGIFRVDAPDVAGNPVTGIKHALVIGGDTFDDDCLIGAFRIEIDQHGNFYGVRIHCRKQ